MKAMGCWIILAAGLAGCIEAPQRPREYREAYQQPLVSPGTKFVLLPPAVQHTVRAETGGAEIADIMKKNKAGGPVYRITFVKGDLLPPLYVAQDGSVLNPDQTVAITAPESTGLPSSVTGRLTPQDLPPKVLQTLLERAPDAQPATIDRELFGNQTVYVITFRDLSHPKLYINPDGTVMAETGR